MKKFESKIWLSFPSLHGDEMTWIKDAIDKNWVTTAGVAVFITSGF